MATATAPAITREILLDRWQGVMKWERTYGNASDEYSALTDALSDLIVVVSGRDAEDIVVYPGEDLLDRIGDVVIESIEAQGIAQ